MDDFTDKAAIRERALAWLQDPDVSMRRWFSRTYHQPPNSPLFDSEPMAYWVAHMMADQEAEKLGLRAALEDAKSRNDAAAVAWRARVHRRLGELGDNVASKGDGGLDADIEAANRGELPEFLKKRMGKSRG